MTMRVLLHIYILLSPGIMDILVDVIYVKLDITDDVQDNMSVIQHQYSSLSICVFENHFFQQLCINAVSRGVITL